MSDHHKREKRMVENMVCPNCGERTMSVRWGPPGTMTVVCMDCGHEVQFTRTVRADGKTQTMEVVKPEE